MYKVFIDGKEGTTGLRIYDRLNGFDGIELISLPEEKRKDPAARAEMINESDISFLCLPDAAAIESVSFIKNDRVRVLDTSTAHRTDPGFAYGFPELSKSFKSRIEQGDRIAVPGCHASGFIAVVYPLIQMGLISKDELLSVWSLTGYSGGGKKMIADYESSSKDESLFAPRPYGLTQNHKHLKEMKYITGIDEFPVFCPIVDDFYSGMVVSVPLFMKQFRKKMTASQLGSELKGYYEGQKLVKVCGYDEGGGPISANDMSGKDSMKISVYGNDDRVTLTAVYDNLGKGASGAAIQCMNLMLGFDETKGLCL